MYEYMRSKKTNYDNNDDFKIDHNKRCYMN